jgi:hypothetical protein
MKKFAGRSRTSWHYLHKMCCVCAGVYFSKNALLHKFVHYAKHPVSLLIDKTKEIEILSFRCSSRLAHEYSITKKKTHLKLQTIEQLSIYIYRNTMPIETEELRTEENKKQKTMKKKKHNTIWK